MGCPQDSFGVLKGYIFKIKITQQACGWQSIEVAAV
jgi:hypothetical protein